MRLFGRGKRVFARLDAEDDKWYYFSLAYIPRALNNRDANDAIVQMFFIGKWKVDKLSLWTEPEDIVHYGHDFNKTPDNSLAIVVFNSLAKIHIF